MKFRFRLTESAEMSNEYDSEGNQLTKEQAEFFKNSKVRDGKGRLLVCYHGTPYTFSTFSHEKTNGQLGADLGYWFTTDKHIAQRFANTHTNDDVLKILQYKNDKEKDYVNRAISILQPFTTKKLVADKETSSIIIASFHFDIIDKVLHKWGIVLDNKSRRELINLQNECIDFYQNEDEYVSQYQSQMTSSATPTVMKVYLLANNVLQENGESIGVSWERYGVISNAEDEGYDAVIITNADTGAGFGTEIVVFDPNQIKSITNKTPTNSDNINEGVWQHKTNSYIDYKGDKVVREYDEYEPQKDSKYKRLCQKPINALTLEEIVYLFAIHQCIYMREFQPSLEDTLTQVEEEHMEDLEKCYDFVHSLKFPLTIYRTIREEEKDFNIGGKQRSYSWTTNINIYKNERSMFRNAVNIIAGEIEPNIIDNANTISNFVYYTARPSYGKFGEYEITLKKDFKSSDIANLRVVNKDDINERLNNINESIKREIK